jgi:ribonuclease-3
LIFRRAYNLFLSPQKEFTHGLRSLIGCCPKNISLYTRAFQHNSLSKSTNSNERLEMLGDSVLNFVVAEYLFQKFPAKQEGFLTEMRSKIVSRVSLNDIAYDMGLQNFIKYNHSIKNVKDNDLLGNALEALIGAIHVDLGYNGAYKFIHRRFLKPHIDIKLLERTEYNFKSKVINWAQSNRKIIEFKLIEEKKVGYRNFFKIGLFINAEMISEGGNFSKKQAEQMAAEHACKVLSIL